MKRLLRATPLFALLSVSCGDRPEFWDAPFATGATPSQTAGLTGSVAVLDPSLNRVTLLTSERPLELASRQFAVGRGVVNMRTSVDRSRLFVLSRGVVPRFSQSDEGPKLIVIDGSPDPRVLRVYDEFKDPYDKVDLDPLGRWLVVRGSEGVVSNPNELILADLHDLDRTPHFKTLSSSGGKPAALTFTSALSAGKAAPRRLLVVTRESDIAILDLSESALADGTRQDVTVAMPRRTNDVVASPLKVAFHDATADQPYAWLAVQLKNDSNVLLLQLGEPTSPDQPFSVTPSLADVGGEPTTIDFVMTDGGLRLAALVPSKLVGNARVPTAVLVDPATTTTDDVVLPYPFSGIARITDAVDLGSESDVALLYGNTPTIAFWALGRTTGTPYRSLDTYQIGVPVGDVIDVPGDEFADYKVLRGASEGGPAQFYVLDLASRQSFPMDAQTNLTLDVAPDGRRLWGYVRGSSEFARLTFDDLHPVSLYTQKRVHAVYDIETRNGRRSLVALHMESGLHGLAATLFDALAPDSTKTRFVTGLSLGGRP